MDHSTSCARLRKVLLASSSELLLPLLLICRAGWVHEKAVACYLAPSPRASVDGIRVPLRSQCSLLLKEC